MAIGAFVGNNQTQQFVFNEYQNALSSPLIQRCSLVSALLQSLPLKDLKYLFGRLVEDVFGFQTKQDWGLLSLDPQVNCLEYGALRNLLLADGPILQLAYKLLDDPQAQFEFHTSCLPVLSRQSLEEGKIPPFYAKKVFSLTGGAVSSFLQLNAFEFFFFHFAYFIINPSWRGFSGSVNQAETVYASLLEDYLRYFLPADGTTVPPIPTSITLPSQSGFLRSPFRSSNQSLNTSVHGSGHSTLSSSSPSGSFTLGQRPRASLLRLGAVQIAEPVPTYGRQGAVSLGSSKSETWRSEDFTAILSEMYLNHSSPKQVQPVIGMLKERFVPSHYHVYMVRAFVKHAHYFANSFTSHTQILNTSPVVIDVLGELKSSILPRYIQKTMFGFLKLAFDRWPLDASFRVPLETWLSYIQPWRYTDIRTHRELEEKGFVNRWQKFVSENLHFYTSFFLQVMQRFSRMDLSCPKTAYMLFRATKVFSQDDLDTMILEAEKNYSATHSRSSSSLLSPFGTVTEFSHSLLRDPSMLSFQDTTPLRAKNTYGYTPLFSRNIIDQASRLLSEIAAMLEKARSLKLANGNGTKNFFSSFFYSREDNNSVPAEDYLPSDSKKLVVHLEASMNNLARLFKLPVPVHSEPAGGSTPQASASPADSFEGYSGRQPSPLRQQPAMKKMPQPSGAKTKEYSDYHGNPDLQPVRTYEYEILVKLFSEVSEFLNSKYAQKINELYFRPSVVGRMVQQLLAPPAVYYRIVKSKDMQSATWEKVHLPPRIYLRVLANKHLMWYLAVYLMIMYFTGYQPLSAVLILFFIVLIIVVCRAVFIRSKPTVKHD